MDQTTKAVKAAVLLYRAVTLLTLALTFGLFISGTGSDMTRTIVFMVWLALGVYSLIRILSDVMSGQHKKEQNFQNTISMFEQNTGSHEAAMRYFTVMMAVSSLLKLAVPFIIWLIFR